jgi:hypothetical protein
MPTCRKCKANFPNRVSIDGKIRVVNRRKFCLSCSPFGRHNTSPTDPLALPVKAKAKALSLRIREHKTVAEISAQLNAPRTAVASWLKGHPLPSTKKSPQRYGYKMRGIESIHHKIVDSRALSTVHKCRIAEAAVLFRLALRGMETYGRVFDGQKSDWVVVLSGKRTLRIQVRWAGGGNNGQPWTKLHCSDGRSKVRRMRTDEFDVLIMYVLFSDTAYVFTSSELRHLNRSISARPEAAEAFWKLR